MVDAALAQVLSVGLVWIGFHCAGMCGPIVGGVVGARASSVSSALLGLLLYQAGRALTLSLLGALAGSVGATVSAVVDDGRAGGALALAFAALLLVTLVPAPAPLLSLRPQRRGVRARVDAALERVGRAVAALAGAIDRRIGRRPFVVGVVLGLLPCMIVAWGLSLAASTGDALRGARVMLVLTAMTTAPLAMSVVVVSASSSVGVVTRLLQAAPALRVLPVVLSAAWLVAVGAAGLGLIEHRHVIVEVFGPRTVMLW